MSKRPSELEQDAKRQANEPTSVAEQALAVLLEIQRPLSTLPFVVNKALLSKLRGLNLPIRTSYDFVAQWKPSTLAECLELGMDRYDIVPAALAATAHNPSAKSAARRFYDQVLLNYPSVDVLNRAARMGPLPSWIPNSVDRDVDLDERTAQQIVTADRLDLLVLERSRRSFGLPLAILAVARLDQLKQLEDVFYRASAGHRFQNFLLVGAVRFARLDILQWVQGNRPQFQLGIEHLHVALEAGHHELAEQLLRQPQTRFPEASTLIEYGRLELIQLAVDLGCSPVKLLTQAISRSKLRLADWLVGLVDIHSLSFTCTSAETFNWLHKHGFQGGVVDFELLSAVATGQLDRAEHLIAVWSSGPPNPRSTYGLWNWAVIAAIRSGAESTAALLGLVLPRLPKFGNLCNVAAKQNRVDLLRLLRQYGAPWSNSLWSAAMKGHSLECLRFARENGCPWPDLSAKGLVDDCPDHDDFWSFLLDMDSATVAVSIDRLLRKPGTVARFRWLKQRVQLAPTELPWPTSGYSLEDLDGVTLPYSLLQQALSTNDDALEQRCTWQAWGIAVSVVAAEADVVCSIRRVAAEEFRWVWPLGAPWVAIDEESVRGLSSATGIRLGLFLHRSRYERPFLLPCKPTRPLFFFSEGQLHCNQEGNGSVCIFLLLLHLARLADHLALPWHSKVQYLISLFAPEFLARRWGQQ